MIAALLAAPSALAARSHLGELPHACGVTAVAVDAENNVWTAATEGSAGVIRGMAIGNGKFYATDTNAQKIDVYSSTHSLERCFSSPNFEGASPNMLAVDTSSSVSAGDIYVSGGGPEFGPEVLKFNSNDAEIGAINDSNLTACSGAVAFTGTFGVAVNPANGDVYVTDPGNGTVTAFTAAGTCLFQVPVGGPFAVAVDPGEGANGTLYVGDRNSGTVKAYDASTGSEVRSFGSGLSGPYGMTVDSSTHRIYVANSGEKVVGFEPNGTCLDSCSAVVPAVAPQAVLADPTTGHLFVSEHEGSASEADISQYEVGKPTPLETFGRPVEKIREFSPYPDNEELQEWTGEGKLDCPKPVESLAVDDVNGLVYASNYCGVVQEPEEGGVAVFEPNGVFKEWFNLGPAASPLDRSIEMSSREGAGIAIDNSGGPSNGRIYFVGAKAGFTGSFNVFYVLAAFEPNGKPAGFATEAPYIEGNQIIGTPGGCLHWGKGACGGIGWLAVGQREGDIYADFKFESSGSFVKDLPSGGELAEDPTNGNLKISCAEFTQSDQEVGSLPCGPAAFDSRGYLYIGGQIYNQLPKIAYENPSEASPSAATVNASVAPPPGETITACKIEYGESTTYGESIECEPSSLPYAGETQIQARITGLTTERTYHYRVVLETAAGQTPGNDQTYTPHHVVGLRTDPATEVKATTATLNASFVGNGEETHYYFEYGTTPSYGETTAPPPGASAGSPNNAPQRTGLSAEIEELDPNTTYHYRVVAENSSGQSYGEDKVFRTEKSVPLIREFVSRVHSESLLLDAHLNPGGGATTYHFEYGLAPCSQEPDPCSSVPLNEALELGGFSTFHTVSAEVTGLKAGTLYYYRLVATNSLGTTRGSDATFATFPYVATIHDSCPNALSRQQTSAALALDCRSYELVSAANAGGYDVESDLVPGQSPFAGYPQAQEPERVLYAVHDGGIPGTDHPTNRGLDPYVATRGKEGWSTEYVGIPADNPFASEPFSSTPSGADASLSTFAFGGEGSCSPCFAGGYTGIPVHLPGGSLVQGMEGPEDPGPAATPDGYIAAPLSADGSHFIFGSTSRFAPGGNSGGDVSLYDHNLKTGETHVISNASGSEDFPTPLACLQGAGHCNAAHGDSNGISELAISADGSHVLVGQKVRSDAAGNVYWHLYMEVNDAISPVDLTPGATSGVLFDGMSEDGTKVYFTTPDKLLPADTDASADIYEAEVGEGSAQLRLISTGPSGASNSDGCKPAGNKNGAHWNTVGSGANCDAVAIGGGGGVSASGETIYFLSPERLAGPGEGAENQPNLYLASPGSAPRFIATLSPEDSTVLDALEAEGRHTADFELSPNGRYAVFTSVLSLSGYENAGFSEVYRYDTEGAGQLDCASCNTTNAAAAGGSTLASNGLSLSEDGRVFFNSNDILALRDTDNRTDVYEWEPQGTEGCGEESPTYSKLYKTCTSLISGGKSPFNSSLLSVTENGKDAYFFTHDTLAPQDHNGPITKIYDARTDGGFFELPEPPPCAASDECHGPGSAAPGQPQMGTVVSEGKPETLPSNFEKCKKGYLRRAGRCVKKHHHHHHHHHQQQQHRKGRGAHHHG